MTSVCVRVPRFAMDFRLVLALSLVLTFSSELVRAKLKGDDCEGNIFCSTSYPIILRLDIKVKVFNVYFKVRSTEVSPPEIGEG